MFTFSIEGDKDLVTKLGNLTKSEFKSAVQFGAKKALEPAKKTAQAIAPKQTGSLRRAIRIRVLKRSVKRVGARVGVGKNDSMFKGKTFYAGFQEYGWKTGRRASNQDLGVAKRKRRTSEQAQEISKMNAARKTIQGKRYLKKSIDSNNEIVMRSFQMHIRDGIRKALKRSATKKFLPVIRN